MFAAANTDNMGKLFVTPFAPAPKTDSFLPLHPDTLICTQFKFNTVTNFLLRDSLYRDTALVRANNFVTGVKFAAPIKHIPRSRQHST
jgi:hypothetical protein